MQKLRGQFLQMVHRGYMQLTTQHADFFFLSRFQMLILPSSTVRIIMCSCPTQHRAQHSYISSSNLLNQEYGVHRHNSSKSAEELRAGYVEPKSYSPWICADIESFLLFLLKVHFWSQHNGTLKYINLMAWKNLALSEGGWKLPFLETPDLSPDPVWPPTLSCPSPHPQPKKTSIALKCWNISKSQINNDDVLLSNCFACQPREG